MKRFTDTDIWKEDWFLDLTNEEKLLFNYIKDNCNHAGVWKPNLRQIEFILGSRLNLDDFLNKINLQKERIIILSDNNWYLTGFIKFQYGVFLNKNNKVHESIFKILTNYNIDISNFEVKERSLLPKNEVILTSKEKDKEKEKDKVKKRIRNIFNSNKNLKKYKYSQLKKYLIFLNLISKNYINVWSLKTQMSIDNYFDILDNFNKETLKTVLENMENKKDLNSSYTSVYLTMKNWCKREGNKL